MIEKLLVRMINIQERCKRAYRTEWVEDMPDSPSGKTVYIVGGRKYPYYAVVPCPRGKCDKMIHLEISPQFKKRWNYKEHEDNSLTLQPSIYLGDSPCRCHYWIRKGRIVWSEWPRSLKRRC